MKYQDYYKTLGVPRSASKDDIKRAYRKLAHKYHPDVSTEADAEERFKELGEAYEVLKDQDKRTAYDDLGRHWQAGDNFSPPPGWGQGGRFSQGGRQANVDFSDFFSSIFGGAPPPGFGGQQRSHRQRQRGADAQVELKISLEDAVAGGERFIDLTSRHDPHSGKESEARKIKVKIPAGISAGQKIRLTGQGQQVPGAASNGDLYLKIEFAQHPLFRVEGSNIHLNVPITPWEAALGAVVKVPTLSGEVELKIPPGSQSGRKLRLKGRGLGAVGQRGDQLVEVQIMTPPAEGDAAADVYRTMAKELPFDPRKGLW